MKRLVIKAVPDEATRLAMLKRGEADVIYLLQGELPASFDFFWQPPGYPFDPQRAKRLLAEAGYPDGFDAGDLWCDAATATMREALASYLQAVGIRVKLRPLRGREAQEPMTGPA